jgi:hypothetical protein
MDEVQLIKLMNKNGFSDKQIAIIEDVSLKERLSIEKIILQLSNRFIILSVIFSFLILLAVLALVLNGDEDVLSLVFVMIVALLFLMKILALDLSFKAWKVSHIIKEKS